MATSSIKSATVFDPMSWTSWTSLRPSQFWRSRTAWLSMDLSIYSEKIERPVSSGGGGVFSAFFFAWTFFYFKASAMEKR